MWGGPIPPHIGCGNLEYFRMGVGVSLQQTMHSLYPNADKPVIDGEVRWRKYTNVILIYPETWGELPKTSDRNPFLD